MTIRRPLTPLALALLAGARLAAAATWTIPGTANTPGRNGTFFVTELKLRNTATAATEASFELLPLSGAAPGAVTRTIAAGETLVLPNALVSLWGAGERAGTVRVTSAQPLFINARTYNNADPTGTFGLAIEAVTETGLLVAGQTGHVGWVSESPDPARGFRTNVGVVLPFAGASADVVVFGAGGTELGRRTFSGGPLATQLSVRDIAGGDLAVARLELRVTAGAATGYSAVVDNVTGDGFTVQPQLVTPGNWTDVTLNGVARGPGRFGTFFRTDVRLVNTGAGARKVTVSGISLVAGGQPFTASATLDLAARSVRELDDILGVQLLAPEGVSGSLRFVADGPVLVLGRTSNIRGDGSTFGAVQRTFPSEDFLAGTRTGAFVGLLQSSSTPGFRTNVGFTAGPAGAVVDLVLKDRLGAVAASRTGAVTLPAFGFFQPSLADLFPGTAIPENATLEVQATAGTVDAYASFIDNGTGDPVIYPTLREAEPTAPNVSANSPCPASPGVAGLVNEGTMLFRVTIDTNRHPDAVCNDGTAGLFFLRKGIGASANRWLIFLEGGGGCGSNAQSCADRWCSTDTNFGAFKMSNRYLAGAKGIGGGGILQIKEDSAFSDFNTVWVHYCTSDSWTGRIRDRVLTDSESGRSYSINFTGGRIVDAVISELREGVTYRNASDQPVAMPSLDDAEVVLLVGESAGGSGVKHNADRVGAALQLTNRTGRLVYRAVIDAADHPTNPSAPDYESRMTLGWLRNVARFASRFDESCVAAHPTDPWRCLDTAHLAENHITTPFFARTDLLDPNVLDAFGTPEWEFGTQLWEFGAATRDHLDRLTRIRSTAEEKAAITIDPGVYGPHCDNHTALRDNGKFYNDKVATGGGPMSFHDTLRNWLLSLEPRVALEPRPSADPVPKSVVCTP